MKITWQRNGKLFGLLNSPKINLFTKNEPNEAQRDHVISIKAKKRDLAKNLCKTKVKWKCFFFSSPFIKNSGTLYSLLILLLEKYQAEENSEEMLIKNHCCKLNSSFLQFT